jgi:hypothetical protein
MDSEISAAAVLENDIATEPSNLEPLPERRGSAKSSDHGGDDAWESVLESKERSKITNAKDMRKHMARRKQTNHSNPTAGQSRVALFGAADLEAEVAEAASVPHPDPRTPRFAAWNGTRKETR